MSATRYGSHRNRDIAIAFGIAQVAQNRLDKEIHTHARERTGVRHTANLYMELSPKHKRVIEINQGPALGTSASRHISKKEWDIRH